MVFYILIALAAFLNAVMDRLENESFHSSIFRKWNQAFWYKRESWNKAKKVFGWKFDGWHMAKSAMVCILLADLVLRINSGPVFSWPWACFNFLGWKWPWLEYIAMGATWNGVFNISYNKILKSKKR